MSPATKRRVLSISQNRHNQSVRFVAGFERQLNAAAACDTGGMIAEALRDGSHGRVYRLMIEGDPAAEPQDRQA